MLVGKLFKVPENFLDVSSDWQVVDRVVSEDSLSVDDERASETHTVVAVSGVFNQHTIISGDLLLFHLPS
jgi:hypothetical protein